MVVGDDQFFFTNYCYLSVTLEVTFGLRWGSLGFFDGAHSTLVETGLQIPNGISTSPDGKLVTYDCIYPTHFIYIIHLFTGLEHKNRFEQLLIVTLSVRKAFLDDRTATQYDRLLAAACCPSVRPSVCLSVRLSVTLCIVALRVGVRG